MFPTRSPRGAHLWVVIIPSALKMSLSLQRTPSVPESIDVLRDASVACGRSEWSLPYLNLTQRDGPGLVNGGSEPTAVSRPSNRLAQSWQSGAVI